MINRFVRLLTLFFLLFAATPPAFSRAADTSLAGLMPPHPRLRDQINQGKISVPRVMQNLRSAQAAGINAANRVPRAMSGSLKTLAVLVDFSDKVHAVTATYFDTLIFAAPVAGRGSVRDYYNEVSYGQVDIVAVTLPSALTWRRAPQTYSYYTYGGYGTDAPYPHNTQKLAEDVVDAINSVVDFSQYDNNHDGVMEPILLIHAGPGAEYTGSVNDIWSHSWNLYSARNYDGVSVSDYVIMPEYFASVSPSTSDMTIGVFAHEMGHGFWGLPDVYDRDYSSSGVGEWSLMAGGSWNGPAFDGSSPAWPDAWNRIQMGFTSPANLTTNVTGQSIPRAYGNSAVTTVYKMRTTSMGAQEFFLLENRQQVAGSYDEYLPGSGLLIWHVDEVMNNYSAQNDNECRVEPHSACSAAHYLLALEQADGLRDLEYGRGGDAGDPFPGSTNNRSWTASTHPESSSWYGASGVGVTNISNSGAAMTFDLQISGGIAYRLFLPFISKPAPPVVASLTNGSFESGSGVGWAEYSTHGWPIVINSGFPGVTPHSGSWAAWLGGEASDISYIQQQITVSASTPYLSYYHWIASADSCGYDFAYVLINGVVVDYYNLCSSANTGGWVKHSINLSAYAEQSVILQIRAETDASNNSNLFVDDVAFAASAAAPALEGINLPGELDPLASLSKPEILGVP
ncbi:MAG: hypothetical protein Fur0035_20300 [Anaerolineales bacterium]